MDDVVSFLNSKRVPVKAADRERRKGPYPYYGASGIVDWIDDFIFEGEYLLVSEDGENLNTRNSPIAFMACGKYWVNNHAHILDEKEPGILRYLSWALNRTDLSPYITGAAQPKLNKRALQSIEIPIPPLHERLAINAVLGALDDKIELNRQTACTLEEMARALYRSWFVDFDPIKAKAEGQIPAFMDEATAALFPDHLNEDGLPVGWSVGRLSELCIGTKNAVKPMDTPDAAFLHFSLPAFDVGRAADRVCGAAIKSNKIHVPHDSILFSRLNPSIPRVWWARTDGIDAIPAASTEFFVAQARKHEETPWLYCLLSSTEFRDEALSRVTGTSNSHQRIPPKALAEIEIIAPSRGVIQAFGLLTAPWFEKYHQIASENRILADLRDTLLPKLMSGDIRVGDAEREVAEVA